MEGIAYLVSASLARHGFTTQLDHRRLQWSKWFRCESSFSVLLVPSKPGLFALAEEVTVVHTSSLDEKRTLTLFRISETDDLGMALGRLFLPNSPERDLLSKKSCFVRYAVIEDEDQRRASNRSLQEWMATASESTNEIPNNLTVHSFAKEQAVEDAHNESPLARTGT
ncbi:MAG: hypothetical protein ACHP8A_12855 [Terriglobales bacterium]|jgi:hypothetical protein